MKQHNKPRKSSTLFNLGFVETIPSPRSGFLRGVFSSQSCGKYWQLNQNNQKTEHIPTQINDT